MTKVLALFLMALCAFAQKPPKPSLQSVDEGVKKAASDQAAASAIAERKAVQRAAQTQSGTELERYKQQERFNKVEEGLARVQADKLLETQKAEADRLEVVRAAKADHEDLVKTIRASAVGVCATLISTLILFGVKFFYDRRHHDREETKLDTIHTLVDGRMTALQDKLEAALAELAVLRGGK